jgi:abortive infection bacteriophage resistance protein
VAIPYSKPYLTIDQQIELLLTRGLLIDDKSEAARILRQLGYYRLSGYLYPFRQRHVESDESGQKGSVVLDEFKPGTKLSFAMDIYAFDKKLRLLLMDALESLEVALRVQVAIEVGGIGPWAHRDPGNFNSYLGEINERTGETRHAEFVRRMDDSFVRSSEEFAKRFVAKYTGPIPIWIAVEVWDFGMLAALVNGLKRPALQRVATACGLEKAQTLPSWVQSLNYVRNVCAHHNRLWNRPMVIQPSFRNEPRFAYLTEGNQKSTRVYGVAIVIQALMRTLHPRSRWHERLIDLIQQFPTQTGLNGKTMGFEDGWQTEPIWK